MTVQTTKEPYSFNLDGLIIRLWLGVWRQLWKNWQPCAVHWTSFDTSLSSRCSELKTWTSFVYHHIIHHNNTWLKANWENMLFQKSVANWLACLWFNTREVALRFREVGNPLFKPRSGRPLNVPGPRRAADPLGRPPVKMCHLRNPRRGWNYTACAGAERRWRLYYRLFCKYMSCAPPPRNKLNLRRRQAGPIWADSAFMHHQSVISESCD